MTVARLPVLGMREWRAGLEGDFCAVLLGGVSAGLRPPEGGARGLIGPGLVFPGVPAAGRVSTSRVGFEAIAGFDEEVTDGLLVVGGDWP